MVNILAEESGLIKRVSFKAKFTIHFEATLLIKKASVFA